MRRRSTRLRAITSPTATIVAHDIGAIGGMERHLTELIAGLLDNGWRVTVVSRTMGVDPHARLDWIKIPGPARPFPIAYLWFALAAGLVLMRRREGVRHVTGAIVPGRADLVTVHLCHHAIAERVPIARTRRSTLPYRLNARISAALSRLGERWCYRPRRARLVAGVSGGVTRELEHHFPSLVGRLITIPNGVDTRTFRPAQGTRGASRAALGVAPGELVALFVGSEWEGKGLGTAIEAVAREERWRLVVVGDGDFDRYRRAAAEAGAAQRVQFAGTTRQVAHYYTAADAFLLPTAYETFSLVTYEAAASGLPLLVSRVSGVEDLLEAGVNGWFVSPDASEIAACLAELADDPERRDAMGGAARAASLSFGWDRMVAGYLEAYGLLSPTADRRADAPLHDPGETVGEHV